MFFFIISDGYKIGDIVVGFKLKNIDDIYKNTNAVITKYLENVLDASLNGKEIDQTETRAITFDFKV